MQPYQINTFNNTCFILPRAKIPNGLHLTYDTCPEHFNNSTLKLVKYCCFIIIYGITQKSIYKKAQDWLRDYSSSLLVIPSVLFNVLALIVLNRFSRLRNYSQTSTTFYMKSVCVLDTLTIISKFLHEIVVVRNASRTSPIVINSMMCKSLFFFESSCSISAIFLLIAMSIDKLICVLIPLKVNQLLTTRRAKIAVTFIIMISGFISSYELVVQQAIELPISTVKEPNDNKTVLSITSERTNDSFSFIRYDCDTQWPERYNDWILFNHIIKVFLPILIICICNAWIVIELARNGRNADALFRNESTASNKFNTLQYSLNASKNASKTKSMNMSLENIEYQKELNGVDSPSSIKTRINKKNRYATSSQQANLNVSNDLNIKTNWSVINIRRKDTTRHISIMLFAVSFGFVILNLPFAIKTLFKRHFSRDNQILDNLYHSENFFTSEYSKAEIKDQVKYEFYSNLTHILLDLNYTANFFLYFFAGSRFRAQLFALFKRKQENNQKNLKATPSNYMKIRFSKINENRDSIKTTLRSRRNSNFD